MIPGTPARATASRPNRLVFRPFDARSPPKPSTAEAARSNTTTPLKQPQPPAVSSSGEKSSSEKPAVDYGIDFEFDDDDAEAIESVFAEYEQKIREQRSKEEQSKVGEESSKTVTKSSAPLLVLPPSSSGQPRVVIEEEEEPAEQEEYHDSLALDSLLDLEFDDAELLAALVSQELPSSQSKAHQDDSKGEQPAETKWNSQDNWASEDVDRQVLLEYEEWVKRTGYVEPKGKGKDIIDETPEALSAQETEQRNQKLYDDALMEGEPAPIVFDKVDPRSPLQRWRKMGKKSKLSVSDLLFNMWCEQQYHYTLLRGFKRRTVEMQAGTKIHREIEEQVHTIVPVAVKTKQDKWGLRIWNMIQGLESLRTMGLTRELEVWGWIDGVFINGVIDEVNFHKPEKEKDEKGRDEKENGKTEKVGDKEEPKGVSWIRNRTEVNGTAPAEEKIGAPPETPKKRGRPKKTPEPLSPEPSTPKQQTSILDFITPSPRKTRSKGQPVYVLDLKTRSSAKIPEPGSSQALSVHIQLMLYRLLLGDMIKATPKSMVKKLCTHLEISATEPFSDGMIAGLAGTGNETEEGGDELSLLLENNSIEKLYAIFHKKLKETISAVAPELTVVYRWQKDGRLMNSADYMADDAMLKQHVDSVISWWKGQRETVGVPVEEAWKCRRCEFVDHCEWIEKVTNERVQRNRERRRAGM